MKRSNKGLCVLVLFLTLSFLCLACGDSNGAAVMQLVKTEGTVRLSNAEGESVSPAKNMRIYSGYGLTTAYKSYAWINLDDVKLAKMDASSEIEIQKNGNDLEIIVNAGKLYFNITEPLDDQETLNIRTSNMAVGIRGTCGWVEADGQRMRVYILEGTVECNVTDPESGQNETAAVSGGETAELSLAYNGEISITVEPFAEEDVDSFVLEEVKQDKDLCDKIRKESGLDISNLSSGMAPGSSTQQAADDIAKLLGDAANENDSLRKKVNDAMEGMIKEEQPDGADVHSSFQDLQDTLLENMLNDTGEKIGTWWMQEFAKTFSSGNGNENDMESDDYMQIRMGRDINCYKPNIYFYGEPGTSFEVSFIEPVLLTKTLPQYEDCWAVEIAEDGTLIVDGQAGYTFLFYESRTIPGIFQTDKGFLVKAEERSAQFREILEDYGLNGQEIHDFIEFWDEMLDADMDYVMYPQTTELVDNAMPIEISGAQIDHYFRLWFCFQKADEETVRHLVRPEIIPACHEKTSMVEWGGMILP